MEPVVEEGCPVKPGNFFIQILKAYRHNFLTHIVWDNKSLPYFPLRSVIGLLSYIYIHICKCNLIYLNMRVISLGELTQKH